MFFTIGAPTYYSLFIFSHGISLVLRSYLMEFAIAAQLSIPILTLLMMLGEMTGGILLFIYSLKTERRGTIVVQSKPKSVHQMSKKFTVILNIPEHKKHLIITYMVIFGLSGIDTFVMYSQYALTNPSDVLFYNFILKEFILVFSMIFSYLGLKFKLFRHHISGIALVMFGFCFANMNHIVEVGEIVIMTFSVEVALSIGYSLFEVYQKKVMDNKFIEPYRILFFLGLFGICILGMICGIIHIVYPYYPQSEMMIKMKTDFDHFGNLFDNAGIFFSGLGFLILSAIVNIGFVLVNYFYSPVSRIMTDINSFFFIWIMNEINKPSNGGFVFLALVGMVIQLIGMLWYHEIIIVHALGFDTFTKTEITNRGKEDIDIAVVELDRVDEDLREGETENIESFVSQTQLNYYE